MSESAKFEAWWATQDVRLEELVYKMVAWNGWLARSALPGTEIER